MALGRNGINDQYLDYTNEEQVILLRYVFGLQIFEVDNRYNHEGSLLSFLHVLIVLLWCQSPLNLVKADLSWILF